MKEKKWLIFEDDKREQRKKIAAAVGISEITAQIMLSRKLSSSEDIKRFLEDDSNYHNPLLLKDCEKAAVRVIQAVTKQEKIVIYGDYDVDGICATALLYRFLRSLGAENVSYYIPDRKTEGYGLNSGALEKLWVAGNSLMLTVDCGISDYQEIEKIKDRLDIIITDHHQPPLQLPEAFAIINPAQSDCPYPFKKLAGVGVAYKLCQAIWQLREQQPATRYKDLVELVALATVADIVALQDENRDLVKQGLQAIKQTKILGLKELIVVSKLQGKKIDAGKIGFVLGPRINAAGRLGSAQLAVKLLTTEEPQEAQEIAECLNNENILRQNIEQEILVQATEILTAKPPKNTIVLAGENWNPGVIGIVASRLVEKHYLPTIIFSIDEQGIAKGSCRSIKALDMHEALTSMKELFLSFGGHHQAAGLSLKADKLAEFSQRFENYVQEKLVATDFLPVLKIDVVVDDLAAINQELATELEQLEPFGEGNPRPNFAIYDLKIFNRRVFQENKSLSLSLGQNGVLKNAVLWREAEKFTWLQTRNSVDIAFNLNIVDWVDPIQLNIRDLKVDCAKFAEKIIKLQAEQINREKIKKFFILLRQEVLFSDKILISELQTKSWFKDFDREYLQILQELDLAVIDKNFFYLKKVSIADKKELNNSRTFRKRSLENQQEQDFLQGLINKKF